MITSKFVTLAFKECHERVALKSHPVVFGLTVVMLELFIYCTRFPVVGTTKNYAQNLCLSSHVLLSAL